MTFEQDFRRTAGEDKACFDELSTFCIRHVKALRMKEKKLSNKPSSLTHWVRLDIGVIEDEEGTVTYFVNEVTRALEMFLFSTLVTDIDFIKKNRLLLVR